MISRGRKVDRSLIVTAVTQMGMSDQEVADLLMCSKSTVQSVRKQLGLSFNAKRKAQNGRLELGGDCPEDIAMCLSCTQAVCDGNIDRCRYRKREFLT